MPDPVARLNAALEGRYAIERELGEGGMATVYLADDLKHLAVSPRSCSDSRRVRRRYPVRTTGNRTPAEPRW